MDITPQLDAGRQLINSYGNGGFRISGRRYDGAVLVLTERVVPLALARISELSVSHIAAAFEAETSPQILLIGCGPSIAPIADEVRDGMKDRGIAVEVMDTGAACRTYNVLLGEDRRVGAILIAVD